MKYLFSIIIIFSCTQVFSQSWNPGNFPTGTSTVEMLRTQYTANQIETMLRGAEISRDETKPTRLGFVFTDPVAKQILVCDNDSFIILFEYIRMLKKEVQTLKNRIDSAGIP